MMQHQFIGSVAGDDVFALGHEIASWPEFDAPPLSLSIDGDSPRIQKPGRTWLRRARQAREDAFVTWSSIDTHASECLWISINLGRDPTVQFSVPRCIADEGDYLRRLLPLPFTVAAVGLPQSTEFFHAYRRLYPGQNPSVFYPGQFDAGLAGLFRGAGHEHVLVSRRWLDYGPWYTERLPNDTTYMQCCDLTADVETMVIQSATANKRLGFSDEGGVFVVGQHETSVVRGIYDADRRAFTIVCAEGRVVSPREMLDACAVKKKRRSDPREPIAAMRFWFADPADARAHLHELWLRELECWTIDEGGEVRLDADYHPEPHKPDWVARVGNRRAEQRLASARGT